MKKIEAFIKTHRLDDVAEALHHVEGVSGMTVTDARGFGRGRSTPVAPDQMQSIVRLEVFCSDTLASTVIEAIETAAHTGLRGDGKIYQIPVDQAVRISSGERGESAL